MEERTFDREYIALVQQLQVLFRIWVDQHSRDRVLRLSFYQWPRGMAYGGPLSGNALQLLCASPDAREMCEWADAQSGNKATLIQGLVAAELCGYKQPGRGPAIPPEVMRKVQILPMSEGGQA